jgi:hypothetical protein
MDKGIKIKDRKLSERCEICHQSDCFSPKTEECSRCAKLNLKPINVDEAIRQYIFSKTFIGMIGVSVSLGIILVYLAYSFEMFFEIFGGLSATIVFIGISSFLYYQYRCRRLVWLVKNIQPINVELICRRNPNSSSFGSHYVEFNLGKHSPIRMPVYPPPWDIVSVANKPYSALAYFDPKGGAILRLDKGILMSLGTPNFSSFLNSAQK